MFRRRHGPLSTVVLDVGVEGRRRSLSSLLEAPGPHRITVLGAAGSGKTTLLRQIAQRNRFARRRNAPILIDLTTQAEQILRGEPSAGVLLLDGLDRIVDPDERAAVSRSITSLSAPGIVVTAGHPHDAIPGSTSVVMLSPTAEQARAIAGAPVPAEFQADPLLLTMAATVQGRTRSELFAAAYPDDTPDAFDLMSQRRWDAELPRPVQEFLAARHIHRTGIPGVLVENVGDPWWNGVTLWWATMASAADPMVDAVVDAVVDAALGKDPVLAFRLAAEAVGIGDALAERLRAFLAGSPRELVARIEVERQLRPFVVTPDGTRLCRHPVSANLYGLFRQDVDVPEPDGSGDPVRGVWDVDAARFVEWANEHSGIEFRLPERLPERCTVAVTDLIEAVAADTEPMLGYLLSLGIRARSMAVERLLDGAQRRARQVLTGFHSRFRARLAARLTVAENRFFDLQRMSPKELGLGIMQVNAEKRALKATIDTLREQIGRLGDPDHVDETANRDEPNWQWAKRVAAAVDRCVAQSRNLFPELGTATAIVDVDAALRLDRQLDGLHLVSAELYGRLEPEAMVGAGTHHTVQRTGRTLRQALADARQVSTVLTSVTSNRPHTTAAEPLTPAISWQGMPDPTDPARSAAAALRGALGPAFAAAMARLLARERTTADLAREFARGLVHGAGFDDNDIVDVLLGECAAAVADMYDRPTRNRLRQRFLAAAGPVFDRTTRGRREAQPEHGGPAAPPEHGSQPTRPGHGRQPTQPEHGRQLTRPGHGRDSTVPERGGEQEALATARFFALILAGGKSADVMRHLAAATVALGRPADETLVLTLYGVYN